jgi:hypothetical protein
MKDENRMKYLKIALVCFGIIAIVGIYPLVLIWPSGFAWHGEGHNLYVDMIVVIYATLGVFLIRAARNPLAHLSLIWFTVWSSIVHGGIMTVQAIVYPQHIGHLLGDVPTLFIIAIVLGVLTPWGEKAIKMQQQMTKG